MLFRSLTSLALSPQSTQLTEHLLAQGAFPAKSADDAAHIAIAAVHGVDAIASWNFRHISGAWARRKIETALTELGFTPPVIASPEALMEIKYEERN